MRGGSSKSKPGTVTGSAAMWAVAAEIAGIYVLSTIPTPLYVIYEQEFHFSQIMLTLIYAAYVVGTVSAMFFFGRLSDQIGRRSVVLVSLGIAGVSALVFLTATNTALLFPARILSGLAIALAAGASTAWLVELEPNHDKTTATQVVIAANLAGLGTGALLSGFLAQYAPWPLRLVYIVFIALLVPISIVISKTQKTIEDPVPISKACLRPRLGVPREIRARFISPAVAAFATFAVLGFYSGLVPSLLSRLLSEKNSAIAGGIVGGLFFVGAATVACARNLGNHSGLIISLGLLLPSLALLATAEALHSTAALFIGTAIAGVAASLAYQCSLRAINEIAPQENRAEVVSSYLIACYAGISLPVIGVGVLSKATPPWIADLVFASVIAVLAVVALVVELVVSART